MMLRVQIPTLPNFVLLVFWFFYITTIVVGSVSTAVVVPVYFSLVTRLLKVFGICLL